VAREQLAMNYARKAMVTYRRVIRLPEALRVAEEDEIVILTVPEAPTAGTEVGGAAAGAEATSATTVGGAAGGGAIGGRGAGGGRAGPQAKGGGGRGD
jgi:hypothetical protein